MEQERNSVKVKGQVNASFSNSRGPLLNLMGDACIIGRPLASHHINIIPRTRLLSHIHTPCTKGIQLVSLNSDPSKQL